MGEKRKIESFPNLFIFFSKEKTAVNYVSLFMLKKYVYFPNERITDSQII